VKQLDLLSYTAPRPPPEPPAVRAEAPPPTLSGRLWLDAGRPKPPGAGGPGVCYVCGWEAPATLPRRKALSDVFTAHDQCAATGSDRVCAGCAWTMGGRSSATLHTWRLYCVLWREDGAVPDRIHPAAPDGGTRAWCANRSDLRPLLRCLLAPPPCAWSASFAVSGQAQCVPFAPLVPAGGRPRVLVERSVLDVAEAPVLLPHVAALRAAGVDADTITSGRLDAGACMRLGAAARRHLDALRTHRGDPLVYLLAWALKRDHAEEFTDDR